MARKTKQKLDRLPLFLYCVMMLWLLFGQRLRDGGIGSLSGQFENNLNLVPFRTILWFWNLPQITDDPHLLAHAFINLVGNVVLFAPLGFLLPRTFPKIDRLWKLIFWVTVAMVLVEVLQLLTTLGSCDVDDVILNLSGAIIGYLVWRIKTK